MKYPASVQKLIDSFSKYPGVGVKTAERLALHTVLKLDRDDSMEFIKALEETQHNIRECKNCGIITESEYCEICSDSTRNDNTIVIVEDIKDVIAIEKSGSYKGKYHILKGLLNPIDGVGVNDIRLRELVERLKVNMPDELILALNTTLEGEQTSLYIAKLLEKVDIKISKLAHGIPVGSNLEYADEITIQRALEGRREV